MSQPWKVPNPDGKSWDLLLKLGSSSGSHLFSGSNPYFPSNARCKAAMSNFFISSMA